MLILNLFILSIYYRYTVFYLEMTVFLLQEGAGEWLTIDSSVITVGDSVRTEGVSGHSVLLDTRIELPIG